MKKLFTAMLCAATFAAAADNVPDSGAAAAAPAAAPKTIAEINACMGSNRMPSGSIQDISLDSLDREGINKTVKLRALWKTGGDGLSRLQMRVVDPPIMAGSAYLVIEKPPLDDVYLYLAVFKVLTHIKPGEMTAPLWGTGVSYVELKQVQGVLQAGTSTSRPDAMVAGRRTWVVDTKTDLDSTGYRRIVSYVDQESCLLTKAEFFTNDSEPLKVLEADTSTLRRTGATWTAGRYTLRTPRERSHTYVVMSPPVPAQELGDALFQPASFHLTPLP